MLISLVRVYSKFRMRTTALFRKHRWIVPAATIANAVLLVGLIMGHFGSRATLVAGACLFITAFVWGYSTRALRIPPWPTLGHLQRRQYAETWDTMASSSKTARIAVCGQAWERQVRDSAAEPVRNLIELTMIDKTDDVLEVASGIGRIGMELAPRCHSWTGADISANMLAYASERLHGIRNVKLHQLRGDGLDGLADEVFDVVYCTNTLAHLDTFDRWRYVQEAFRVLRGGGRIFLDDIDMTSDPGWTMFLNLTARYQKEKAELPPYMTWFSTPTELVTYVTRAGFVQVRSHDRPPLVIVTAVKPGPAS